jgi:Xaa-Pro dipeptidase
VQHELLGQGLRGVLISDPANLFYLSGHLISEGNAPALLVVPVDGTPALIVHDEERTLQSVRDFTGALLTYNMRNSETALQTASRCFRNAYSDSLHPLGIESDSLPVQCAAEMGLETGGDWKDIHGIMARFRTYKDDDEIKLLRTAASVADAGQRAARELFKKGISEIELLSGCRAAMEKMAGRSIGFLADVLIGEKTALIGSPDGVAGELCAGSSDSAIVDILPQVGGYFADTTRTLWSGKAPTDRKGVVLFLQEVKRDLEKLLRPGVQAIEIDGPARERLNNEGSFPHHTGHGLGISHYEAPFIHQNSRDVLEAGMVITLEPGLYYDDWGARIEDDYLITPDGFERLTRSEGG